MWPLVACTSATSETCLVCTEVVNSWVESLQD